MPKEKVVIQHLISSVNGIDDDILTKWEEDFIASVTDQWDRSGKLTDRQVEILERIYKEKA